MLAGLPSRDTTHDGGNHEREPLFYFFLLSMVGRALIHTCTMWRESIQLRSRAPLLAPQACILVFTPRRQVDILTAHTLLGSSPQMFVYMRPEGIVETGELYIDSTTL